MADLPKLGPGGGFCPTPTGTVLRFDRRSLVGSPVVMSRPNTSDPRTFFNLHVALMSLPPALQLART